MIALYHLKVYIGLDHRGQIVHGPTTHDCLQLMLNFFFFIMLVVIFIQRSLGLTDSLASDLVLTTVPRLYCTCICFHIYGFENVLSCTSE